MNSKPLLSGFLLLTALAAPALAQADPRYIVTVVGGADSYAADLNNSGQVVGANLFGGVHQGFLYSSGALTQLGTLGFARSWAESINDSGQVAGGAGNNVAELGFIYSGGMMNAIPGSRDAAGINNSGTVVGTRSTINDDGNNVRHAYSYADGVLSDLGTLPYGDESMAYAINSAGHVVGAAANTIQGFPNLPTTSFLYAKGVMSDLGAFEGNIWAAARAINDQGQIVGYSGINDPGSSEVYPSRAFLYADGVLQNLGSLAAGLSSYAYDINQLGQIVGAANTGGGGAGFLYEDGAMTDLNTLIDPASGWVISDASGINDLQQIAATACKDGECYAVRLDLAMPIPEPATWGMLLTGAMLMGLWRRGRQPQAGLRG